jgi:hypothetical protein
MHGDTSTSMPPSRTRAVILSRLAFSARPLPSTAKAMSGGVCRCVSGYLGFCVLHLIGRSQGRDGAQFKLGNGTNFCYQHDIRAVNSSPTQVTLDMHDNANCPIDNGTTPTSDLTLGVDLVSLQVSLNKRYLNPKDPIFATAQGNFERLSDGHVFLGHGYQPKLEEFDASGEIVMTVQFGSAVGVISYRAFRQAWIGCPSTPPVVVAKIEGGETAVYVSWNGATEYDNWSVYGGESAKNLTLLATVPRNGFETRFTIGNTSLVQVEASTVDAGKKRVCEYAKGRKSAVHVVK